MRLNTPQRNLIIQFDSPAFQVEQIQAEFKVLAKQFHPDKNDGDKEAEAQFQKLKVRTVASEQERESVKCLWKPCWLLFVNPVLKIK